MAENRGNVFSLSSRGQKSEIKVSVGPYSLWRLGGKYSLPLPTSSGSWHSLGRVAFFSMSLRVKPPSPFSYKNTSHWGLGWTLDAGGSHPKIPNLTAFAKILFLNEVTFTGTGLETWTSLFGGHNSGH